MNPLLTPLVDLFTRYTSRRSDLVNPVNFLRVTVMNAPSRTRWKIACLLCGVAVVNFFQRVNISVAGDPIMKAFHLTQTQMGNVFSAFVLGYTLFQVPGGHAGGSFWSQTSFGMGDPILGAVHVPHRRSGKDFSADGVSVLNALYRLRFLFGLCEGPMFPASARAVANWFPLTEKSPSQRPRDNRNQCRLVLDAAAGLADGVEAQLGEFVLSFRRFLDSHCPRLVSLRARLAAQHWAVNALDSRLLRRECRETSIPVADFVAALLAQRELVAFGWQLHFERLCLLCLCVLVLSLPGAGSEVWSGRKCLADHRALDSGRVYDPGWRLLIRSARL